jgi:hypothetical protein
MKDKGAIPNSMVHAEEANRIITIEGNRNFSFFCLVSMWLSGLRPVYSSMVRKMNMPNRSVHLKQRSGIDSCHLPSLVGVSSILVKSLGVTS